MMMALRLPLCPSPSPPPPRRSLNPLPQTQPTSLLFRSVPLTSKCRLVRCASNPHPTPKPSENPAPILLDDEEPFHGKSGCASFHGLTYQKMEENKLESAPFKEGTGSRLWALGPAAFIASLVIPQFLIANFLEPSIENELFSEILGSLVSEAAFYAGLAVFLLVTERVQKPYLQFSAKRWGLITGLKGYLSSAYFTMGFKVMAPLFIVYVTWPSLGLAAGIAVAPFLLGCLAQFLFEINLESRGSSSWPIVPIIFEVYRIYQLTKALHFIQNLLFQIKEAAVTPKVLERSGALLSMAVTFQVLGVLCLWSLLSFLMRLFPSRPVVDRY